MCRLHAMSHCNIYPYLLTPERDEFVRWSQILTLNKEGIEEKISYQCRDYEAVAHAPQSKGQFT